MLPGMAGRPHIAIVGAGNLGSALAFSLRRSGYVIEAIISRPNQVSLRKARSLAKQVGAAVFTDLSPSRSKLIWFCVPDAEIAGVARNFASKINWKGRVALHSSGALSSDELAALRNRGAAVASAHPLMTFVRGSRPPLAGVSFAFEGDAPAVRLVRQVIKDIGAQPYPIQKKSKAAYHAWGTFASPLFTALLATTEQVASLAGVNRNSAKRRMIPILLQTLANYAAFETKDAFSGPIIRGDLSTVRRHIRTLRRIPIAQEVYLSLANAALEYLPGKDKKSLKTELKSARRLKRRE